MTPRERTRTALVVALQMELDAERDRRHAETQRADRERARRLAQDEEHHAYLCVCRALGCLHDDGEPEPLEDVLAEVRRLRDDANRCDVCAKEGVTISICGGCR